MKRAKAGFPRRIAARLLAVVELGALLSAGITAVLAVVYASHRFLGHPPDLRHFPWLAGPAWATVVGIGLRFAVSWILWDAARKGRRRLMLGREPGGG